VNVERAGPDDAPRLRAVAVAAKGHWGYPDDWLARWEAQLTLDAAYVLTREVHVARADGQIVGFYSLRLRGRTCYLDDLWVVPARIGTGIGRVLFEHARGRAAALGAARLEWEAEPGAVGFYQHVGGRPIGTVVTSMEREIPVMAIDLPVPSDQPAGSTTSSGAETGDGDPVG
jgi:GNAT superfamily N-acetyltransferase